MVVWASWIKPTTAGIRRRREGFCGLLNTMFSHLKRWGFLVGFVGLLVVVVWGQRHGGGPRYQGRSARAWFQDACRSSLPSGGGLNDGLGLRARTAFVELGTNAIPFLVREALTLRKENPFRTRLHGFFLGMPDWAGRGAFLPYSHCVDTAVDLLRALSPPSGPVIPLLEPSLAGADRFTRLQALQMLGSLGAGGEAAVPLLLPWATQTEDGHAQTIAWQSIRLLGNRGSNALPALLERAARDPVWFRRDSRWPDWLAGLGPQALSAVPLLEQSLEQTNDMARARSALALVRLQPEHPLALSLVREEAEALMERDPSKAWNSPFLNSLWMLPFGEDERLAAWMEPIARKEAAGWDRTRGGSMVAMYALERISKSRARTLYEELMKDPNTAGLLGAAGLLRLDPNHPEATRRLVEALPQGPGSFPLLFHFLGSASGTNAMAVQALEDVVSGNLKVRPLSIHGNYERIHRAQASEALARIRYRAARAAKGLPDREW